MSKSTKLPLCNDVELDCGYKKYVLARKAGDGLIEYGVVDIKTGNQIPEWSGNKLADYSFIEQSFRSLTGRILTIIDASISDTRQNKSIKDLIRKEFVNEFSDVQDLLFDEQRLKRAMADDYPIVLSNKDILEA